MKILLLILFVSQVVFAHGTYTKAKLEVWKDSIMETLQDHEEYIADDMQHKRAYHKEQKIMKAGTGEAHSNLIKVGDGLLFGRIIDGLFGLLILLGGGGKVLAFLKSKGITIKLGSGK